MNGEEQTAEVLGSRGAILVVDDDAVSRALLERSLSSDGFMITTAADGRQAVELLGKRSFDLVILDIEMPSMTGLEVLQWLRERRTLAELPVIMVTSRDARDDVVGALRAGANDYITKPFDRAVIRARVETQFSLKEAVAQVQVLNRKLGLAQERIAQLLESLPQNLEDLSSWSSAVAADIVHTIGARQLAIWIFDHEKPYLLTEAETPQLTAEEIEALKGERAIVERGADMLFRVSGLSGELFGALIVNGMKLIGGSVEQRLLISFARQLGGALELRHLRQSVAEAEQRRQGTRQELLDRGVDLVRVCRVCGRCYEHRTTHCGADQSLLDEPLTWPYRIADRYRLVRLLGEGSMGTVFEAEDSRLGREAAVKIIKHELCHDPVTRFRFEREAKAVARIDHPGVIAVFDSGEIEDGSLFIIMELLHGLDLAAALKTWGRGAPAQVAELLRQGSAALGAAHRAGLVHRDIKPGNIFLLPGAGSCPFRVKLLDFSVVKELDCDTELTAANRLIGTPMFMSPEQAQSKAVDQRSDIYSLAAVAFLALTGHRVSAHYDLVHILIDLIARDAPPVSAFLPGTPQAVDEAFAWALSRSPDDRPHSAEQWAASFVDKLETMPSSVVGWLLETVALERRPPAQAVPEVDGDAPTLADQRQR